MINGKNGLNSKASNGDNIKINKPSNILNNGIIKNKKEIKERKNNNFSHASLNADNFLICNKLDNNDN